MYVHILTVVWVAWIVWKLLQDRRNLDEIGPTDGPTLICSIQRASYILKQSRKNSLVPLIKKTFRRPCAMLWQIGAKGCWFHLFKKHSDGPVQCCDKSVLRIVDSIYLKSFRRPCVMLWQIGAKGCLVYLFEKTFRRPWVILWQIGAKGLISWCLSSVCPLITLFIIILNQIYLDKLNYDAWKLVAPNYFLKHMIVPINYCSFTKTCNWW